MTNLNDEVYAALNDDLCNLTGWLVQNDTEVILYGDQCHALWHEHQKHLGKDAVGWVRSIRVVEHLEHS